MCLLGKVKDVFCFLNLNPFLFIVVFSQRNNRPFLCCIVDEASQCTEPESLTPLILGVNKLVMVGDPEQLPATVCSKVLQLCKRSTFVLLFV